MNNTTNGKISFFTYKGFPLVRKDNIIYFGNMSDDYVVMLQIQETKKINNLDIATKVKIYQMSTDDSLNAGEAVIRTSERNSLYKALDLANAWLAKALSH